MCVHPGNSTCEDRSIVSPFGYPLSALDEFGYATCSESTLSPQIHYKSTSSRIFAMLKHETVDDG